MSGLRKQKNYDWKDSNLALFGSDTDKQVGRTITLTFQTISLGVVFPVMFGLCTAFLDFIVM